MTPLSPQPEADGLEPLKAELGRRWPMISLLDMLKEADLRTGFTEAFASSGDRETLDRATLRRRLLLCLYGMGTNTGLRRVAAGQEDVSYKELLHVRRRFLHRDGLAPQAGGRAEAISPVPPIRVVVSDLPTSPAGPGERSRISCTATWPGPTSGERSRAN